MRRPFFRPDAAPVRNLLLTGATSGIGEAVAERFARRGAERVFFCGRDAERLAAVAERLRALGAEARPERLDVSDADATRDWIRRCDAEAPLDLVYANAGVSADGREDDEAPAAAEIIVRGIERGRGIVSFPWQMRLAAWWIASPPEFLSERLFRLLPEKTGPRKTEAR